MPNYVNSASNGTSNFFSEIANNTTDVSFSDAFEQLIKTTPVWCEHQILQFGQVVKTIKRMNDHEIFYIYSLTVDLTEDKPRRIQRYSQLLGFLFIHKKLSIEIT